ncbi:MAG: hypothetical protein IMZ46_02965 [Acidobacteria bacterium]|nr:hypothetical protein [Acidobacteriota bacterium]
MLLIIPSQVENPDLHFSQADLEGINFFFGEAHKPVHRQDDVEQLHSVSGEGRRILAESRDHDPVRFQECGLDAGVIDVFKPQVNVLRHDRRSLKGRGRRADEHELDLLPLQFS